MATATARRSKKSRSSKPRARTLNNMIGGKFVPPADGEREAVIDPATGETIARAPLSGKRDVDAAVKAARAAFDGWSTLTPGERSNRLLKMADAIEARAEEIADLEAADAGKPRSAFFEDEIPFIVDNLRYFAGAARRDPGLRLGINVAVGRVTHPAVA
ncbi:MAG TPA: aldehyde dehydrogenase family protein, partial [Solirubrobacterales bacterium]|nr:aldehyde dehydrogenase family protein [Solirubrobacterales bacterium]